MNKLIENSKTEHEEFLKEESVRVMKIAEQMFGVSETALSLREYPRLGMLELMNTEFVLKWNEVKKSFWLYDKKFERNEKCSFVDIRDRKSLGHAIGEIESIY
jgi:hypothetical protein